MSPCKQRVTGGSHNHNSSIVLVSLAEIRATRLLVKPTPSYRTLTHILNMEQKKINSGILFYHHNYNSSPSNYQNYSFISTTKYYFSTRVVKNLGFIILPMGFGVLSSFTFLSKTFLNTRSIAYYNCGINCKLLACVSKSGKLCFEHGCSILIRYSFV